MKKEEQKTYFRTEEGIVSRLIRYSYASSSISHRIFRFFSRNLHHVYLPIELKNIQTLRLPHPFNIVVHSQSIIGENVIIYHGVTLGAKRSGKNHKGAPHIENNVIIFPNSTIIGNVLIGANSVIAAGSVVTCNVPRDSIAAGNPAKVIGIIQ